MRSSRCPAKRPSALRRGSRCVEHSKPPIQKLWKTALSTGAREISVFSTMLLIRGNHTHGAASRNCVGDYRKRPGEKPMALDSWNLQTVYMPKGRPSARGEIRGQLRDPTNSPAPGKLLLFEASRCFS